MNADFARFRNYYKNTCLNSWKLLMRGKDKVGGLMHKL